MSLLKYMLFGAIVLTGCEPETAETGFGDMTAAQVWGEGCEVWDEWDAPGPPFKVFGNTHYVGTCGITALLVETADGLVLIDSGTEAGAERVLANVRELGFAVEDIRILLASHEHFDHVGGFARVVEVTGAKVVASGVAAEVLRTGRASADDPQAGMHDPMAPVGVARELGDGVDLGGVEIRAVATPGHTPGAMSYGWRSCEGEVCRDVVYADSLSPVSREDYRFSDHAAYMADYREGLTRLRDLPCDLLLTPHPSASGMVVRAREGFVADAERCERYVESVEGKIRRRLAEEAASAR